MYVRTDVGWSGRNKGVMRGRTPDEGSQGRALQVQRERSAGYLGGRVTLDLSFGFGCDLKIGPWIGAP
jgi:hypothetical protein